MASFSGCAELLQWLREIQSLCPPPLLASLIATPIQVTNTPTWCTHVLLLTCLKNFLEEQKIKNHTKSPRLERLEKSLELFGTQDLLQGRCVRGRDNRLTTEPRN